MKNITSNYFVPVQINSERRAPNSDAASLFATNSELGRNREGEKRLERRRKRKRILFPFCLFPHPERESACEGTFSLAARAESVSGAAESSKPAAPAAMGDDMVVIPEREMKVRGPRFLPRRVFSVAGPV